MRKVDPTNADHQRAFLLGQKWRLTGHAALHLAVLMRLKPGLVVTSGRRSAAENERVGGVPGSFHLKGRAVDLVGPLQTLLDARALARTVTVSPWCTAAEEALLEYAGTRRQHLHVAW